MLDLDVDDDVGATRVGAGRLAIECGADTRRVGRARSRSGVPWFDAHKRCLLLLVSLVVLPRTASAEDGNAPVINRLAPVQLQWSVLGEFGNGAGVRGNANVFLPNLPVFGGITAGWLYGVDSSHVAGERNGVLTR